MAYCINEVILNAFLILIGIFASIAIVRYVKLWFDPIRRDWELSNGHLVRRVLIFSVSVALLLAGVVCLLWLFCPEILTPDGGEPTPGNVFWSVLFQYMDPGFQGYFNENFLINALVAILGVIVLNGLMISTLTSWFDNRRAHWLYGEIRYDVDDFGKHKFAVVIGANEVVSSVIKNLLTRRHPGDINNKSEADNDYVLLQTSRNAQKVRAELSSHLTKDELKKVVIYKASRDSKIELNGLHLEYCTEIYVLGESTLTEGGETYHDAMSMRCVNLIADILDLSRDARTREKLVTGISARKVCKVLFEYQTTYSILQFSDVADKVNQNLVFIPFNRYESWARKVMVDSNAFADCGKHNRGEADLIIYTPLDRGGISSDSERHVHFVVVGMSKMGVAMGVQAMLQAHYMNYAHAETLPGHDERVAAKRRARTRITFIDTRADKEMDFFTGRYDRLFSLARHRYIEAGKCSKEQLKYDSDYAWVDPMNEIDCEWAHLSTDGENFIDLEIEFIKGELESAGVRNYLECISDTGDPAVALSNLTIAICLTRTHQAVAASLYMPVGVYKTVQEIWVYQREAADILLNLTKTNQQDKRYKKLQPFGMLYGEYMCDRTQYLKSLLANGMYYLGEGSVLEQRNLADKDTYADLRDIWRELILDKKFSNRYFVDSIPLKIRSLGLDSDCVGEDDTPFANEYLAISEHNRWNVQQLMFGYSPCTQEVDRQFRKLNVACGTDEAIQARNAWREKVGWKALTPKQQGDLKREDKDYKELAHGIFDAAKKSYKEGESRMHPNICDYSHLDLVDSGAKGYDKDLNKIIPTILKLIHKSRSVK